jgi:hypothetical protein
MTSSSKANLVAWQNDSLASFDYIPQFLSHMSVPYCIFESIVNKNAFVRGRQPKVSVNRTCCWWGTWASQASVWDDLTDCLYLASYVFSLCVTWFLIELRIEGIQSLFGISPLPENLKGLQVMPKKWWGTFLQLQAREASFKLSIGPIGTLEYLQVAREYILSIPQPTRVIWRDRGCLAAPHSPTLLERMRVRDERYVSCCIGFAAYARNSIWLSEVQVPGGCDIRM